MTNENSQLSILLDLEARHDDLLRQLDELDQRVMKTLSECLSLKHPVEKEILKSATHESLSG